MIVTTNFHQHVKLSIWRVKVSIIISALIRILALLPDCFADRKDRRESEEKTAAGQSSRLLSGNGTFLSPAKPLISIDPGGNERGGAGPIHHPGGAVRILCAGRNRAGNGLRL